MTLAEIKAQAAELSQQRTRGASEEQKTIVNIAKIYREIEINIEETREMWGEDFAQGMAHPEMVRVIAELEAKAIALWEAA